MASLSVIIITHNEEKNIGRCIGSVKQIADEVIVLDSFSTDRTAELATGLGAKCYFRAFSGYGDQKNSAAQMATHDHVLYLDADEYIGAELNQNILYEKERGFPCDGYFMNRLSYYCGRWIRHSSWYPDRKLRLVRRDKALWSTDLVHESLDPGKDATLGNLKGDLLHLPYADQETHVAKIDRYSSLAAKRMHQQRKRPSRLKIIFSPLASFISGYFLHAGFLDGLPGFMIAIHSAYYTFLKYAKLRQLSSTDAAAENPVRRVFKTSTTL
ncbi:MAG TPA: glycosyltransferase family 2 protein [Puia sp.]|nr:glycosyltransferase family 2 protein [Puia sp.]